jgi:hypothetical protein
MGQWNRPDQALTFDQEVDGFETSHPGEKECHVKIALQQRFEVGRPVEAQGFFLTCMLRC